MLRPDREVERVYLHRAPVDMRRQIDGLSILAKEVMSLDPMSGAMFVFINRRRNKLKILLWERNGFIVWYKRLEQQRFHWPRTSTETVLTLTGEQLNWLLDGYDVWRMKPLRIPAIVNSHSTRW
jgi:transposase